MNEQNRENQSSYNRDWNEDRNRENYGSSSYGRNRMGNNDYNNTGSGYGSGNDYGNRHHEQNRSGWQNSNAYNDRYGQGGDWSRNQMQGMSGHRSDNDWNDQGGGYNSGYSNNYGRRGYMAGYGDPLEGSGNSGAGYTGAGGYISNRGYGDRDRESNRGREYNQMGNDRNRDWWDRTKDEVSSWFGDDDAERRRRRDEVSGPHRGKGPKDYQRSDDRIREDVCDRLSDDDRIDASNVQVQIQNNEVVLSGTVRSKEEKRRAEDLVESISGVRHVENRLRVNYGDTDSLSSGTTGSARTTGTDVFGTERNSIR